MFVARCEKVQLLSRGQIAAADAQEANTCAGVSGQPGCEQLARYLADLICTIPRGLQSTLAGVGLEVGLADLDLNSAGNLGQVIGKVMKSGEDVDGALVARLVKEALASTET